MLARTPEDIAYVKAHFVTRNEIARGGDAPFGIAIPAATYRTEDAEWFARDVWRLADDAGGIEGVRTLFARRFAAGCEALHFDADLDEAWTAYLEGAYGACLRDVTPETIVMKERLVARLTSALGSPQPTDALWCARLHADVDALDGLEKPFATCDRTRFGPTTRDRLITAPRAHYAEVFAAREVSQDAPRAATRERTRDSPRGVAQGDVANHLPNRPGALAALGEALGNAGCSIEGGGGFAVSGEVCIVHFLFDDPARAAAVLQAAGFEVLAVREVVAHRLDQEKPGQLGATARALATAGVNIETVYSDHDGRLILGVDNVGRAREVVDALRMRDP